MSPQDTSKGAPHPLPARQVFRSHQRAEFNAAIQEAAKIADALLTVEMDHDGKTIAVINTRPLDEVQS